MSRQDPVLALHRIHGSNYADVDRNRTDRRLCTGVRPRRAGVSVAMTSPAHEGGGWSSSLRRRTDGAIESTNDRWPPTGRRAHRRRRDDPGSRYWREVERLTRGLVRTRSRSSGGTELRVHGGDRACVSDRPAQRDRQRGLDHLSDSAACSHAAPPERSRSRCTVGRAAWNCAPRSLITIPRSRRVPVRGVDGRALRPDPGARHARVADATSTPDRRVAAEDHGLRRIGPIGSPLPLLVREPR